MKVCCSQPRTVAAQKSYQPDHSDAPVQVETVATTLALGEQNHAEELKRVCLEFVSRNLGAVMLTEGYQHMIRSCPQLQVRLSAPCMPSCAFYAERHFVKAWLILAKVIRVCCVRVLQQFVVGHCFRKSNATVTLVGCAMPP